MYRQSDEPRFAKKRDALQRAFIDLTLEKKTMRLTVKEITEHAGVNRMTFYSHYDEVSDILAEFIDGLAQKIIASCEGETDMDVRKLLESATDSMQEEVDFYRLVARDEGFEPYHAIFRKAFNIIFIENLNRSNDMQDTELDLIAGMIASGVTYAYLDWLAGEYGSLSLDDLVSLCERFAKSAQSSHREPVDSETS